MIQLWAVRAGAQEWALMLPASSLEGRGYQVGKGQEQLSVLASFGWEQSLDVFSTGGGLLREVIASFLGKESI